MRVITLWQPWATLIAFGLKEYETRSWETGYQGDLLIHAAKRPLKEEEWQVIRQELPAWERDRVQAHAAKTLGCVIAKVKLRYCLEMTDEMIHRCSAQELAFGFWEAGRYAWGLTDPQVLCPPIPLRGRQGLFKPPQVLLDRLNEVAL